MQPRRARTASLASSSNAEYICSCQPKTRSISCSEAPDFAMVARATVSANLRNEW